MKPHPPAGPHGEQAFLESLYVALGTATGGAAAPGAGELLRRGVGDDAAVFAGPRADEAYVVSTDSMNEGVHFRLAWAPPRQVGAKLIAVSVSDVIAMGAVPRFGLLNLAAPRVSGADGGRGPTDLLWEIFLGASAAAARYGVTLIGGDTTATAAGLALASTVIGVGPSDRLLFRSGARPGDALFVSGELGAAATGLWLLEMDLDRRMRLLDRAPELKDAIDRQLCPDLSDELELGPALARDRLATAMMDISDGLATDLRSLCAASRVGALVDVGALPRSPAAVSAGRLGCPIEASALCGGEDYRLLFSARPAATAALALLPRPPVRIGVMTSPEDGIVFAREGKPLNGDLFGYDAFPCAVHPES
ncbi:MAG: thiamine-phosphate kinase [Candidatus Schekmanbacteria bacterium]|nr:thiamine-phosphate kinase [Candidatus Schekmanbacteria bacterium]